MRQTELRLQAEALGIVKVDAGKDWGRFEFGSSTPVDPLVLVKKCNPRRTSIAWKAPTASVFG